MKLLLSLFFSVFLLVSPKLSQVRIDYVQAINNKEKAVKLHADLSEVSKKDTKVLVAYKGATLTLMAKYAKSVKDKKTFFKEGASLIEWAVSEKPNDIEIRLVRLGVQENAPKVVKYRKNKEEDKQFLLTHYKEITSITLKMYVKGFIMQSSSFSEDEKLLFN